MYKIDEKLAQAILNYLAKQTYADVFELVQAVQQLEEIKKDEKNKKHKHEKTIPTGSDKKNK